jgi:hypothetical protein
MISTYYSDVRKQLALRFILQNIDYRKRCLYLQDIIFLGKRDDVWLKALERFFDIPLKGLPFKKFSEN